MSAGLLLCAVAMATHALLLLLSFSTDVRSTSTGTGTYTDNINGTFAVYPNFHYSNKSTPTWGQNGELSWGVYISLSESAATYNCTPTGNVDDKYTCDDPVWQYDWNKLWGKARCGYLHDHHEDSDRFDFRKCSDASCAAFLPDSPVRIQIGAYAYDGGNIPYDPAYADTLMKTFRTTISPDRFYYYSMEMQPDGNTLYSIFDASPDNSESKVLLETVTIQHQNLCSSNYFEGRVNGLYFGGTCPAPSLVVVDYYVPAKG